MTKLEPRKIVIIGLVIVTTIVGLLTIFAFSQNNSTQNVFTALTDNDGSGGTANNCSGACVTSISCNNQGKSVIAGSCVRAGYVCCGYAPTARTTTTPITVRTSARATSPVVTTTPRATSTTTPRATVTVTSSASGGGNVGGGTPVVSTSTNNAGSGGTNGNSSGTPTSTGTCNYGSTQSRVQKDITDPWKQTMTVACGTSFNIGGFHDGTGLFANDVTLRVTGPNGFSASGGNGSKVTLPNVSGAYTLTVTTNGCSNSGNLTETATVTCTGGTTTTTTTTTSNPTAGCGNMDVDSDGKLTLTDLSNFAKLYKKSCTAIGNATFNTCGPVDSDKNGKVDLPDLSHFGKLYKAGSCAL